ncbi:hypothetical protein B0A55_07732 [Friedmanniomyces simplex]|uniref:Uncharacterized protein n=1 Tax=Friedmanniomyces simplex TaxID=329884 RepID=A0A4U0X2M7_9PEZI|nr:hypothetical protein B0A55_07732 [Friedmanniomyces simplex]
MDTIKQGVNYVTESVGLTDSTDGTSNLPAGSNDGMRNENTRPTGETSELMSGGRPQTLPKSDIADRVQERGLGETAPGMSEGGGILGGGMSSAGFEDRQQSGLGSSGSQLGTSSSGPGSSGSQLGTSNSGFGERSSSGLGPSGSGLGSSNMGLGSSGSGLGSSIMSGGQGLRGEDSSTGGGGIVTTEDGRQTYAADGYGGSSIGNTSTGSGLDAERIAGTVFGQSSTAANGSSLRDTDATSSLGSSGLGSSGLGSSGIGSSGLERSGTESTGTSGAGYPTGSSGSRTNYPTLDNPDVPVHRGGNDNTATDSTASGRNDINTSNRNAPADYTPDPASTEGSAEVAAENPEMASKEMAGTTDESAGGAGSGSGTSKGGPHSSSRENESAIPFAGGERLGEKHWGESKKVAE